MKENKKTITDIDGVYSGAIHAGIKKEKLDLGYIYLPSAYSSAGVFTKNKFKAPCIKYTKNNLKEEIIKAVIVNSGNANSATGNEGYKNAKKTSQIASTLLNLKSSEIAIASTGIIGIQLPMTKIENGLEKLLTDPLQKNGSVLAEAIKTTDLITKEVYKEMEINGEKIVVAGIAKGSGMIAPNMGTMLCFLVTNAKISSKNLKIFLDEAVDDTFNMLSIDTDCSTNDLVLMMSTGEKEINLKSIKEINAFQNLLNSVCLEFTKLIAIDGEGAEHLIEVHLKNAVKKKEAKLLAMNVVNSPLVKTAIHGCDPNWGRIIAALGKNPDLKVKPNLVDLFIQGHQIMKKGEVLSFEREKLKSLLRKKEVIIEIDLNLGKASATSWGCDLTKGYIEINADYN